MTLSPIRKRYELLECVVHYTIHCIDDNIYFDVLGPKTDERLQILQKLLTDANRGYPVRNEEIEIVEKGSSK